MVRWERLTVFVAFRALSGCLCGPVSHLFVRLPSGLLGELLNSLREMLNPIDPHRKVCYGNPLLPTLTYAPQAQAVISCLSVLLGTKTAAHQEVSQALITQGGKVGLVSELMTVCGCSIYNDTQYDDSGRAGRCFRTATFTTC